MLVGSYSGYKNVKEIVINVKNKFLWDQYYVPKFVKNEKIDIIFDPKLSVPLFAPEVRIFTMHGLEQFALPGLFKLLDNIYFHIMMPLYCRRAHSIIVMTNTGKKDLQKYLKVNSEKIEVIYESFHERFRVINDKDRLNEIKNKYKLPQDYLLFVGGLTPLKNFSNILRAFNIIRLKIPIKLVVVGFKRWKYTRDVELIKRLRLDDEIITLGFIASAILASITTLLLIILFKLRIWRFLWIAIAVFLGFTIIIFISLNEFIIKKIEKSKRLSKNFILVRFQKFYKSYSQYKNHKLVLAVFLILSIIEQFAPAIGNYLASLALNINVPFIYFLLIMPLIQLISRIPVSFEGFGVSEGLLVYFFALFGFSKTGAFSIGLLGHIAIILAALPALFFYFKDIKTSFQKNKA